MRRQVVAIVLLGALGACTNTFSAQVTRFQQLPAPAGQTFTVVAADPAKAGSLEFATYAGIVREKMMKVGFAEAPDPKAATMVAAFDWTIGPPRTLVESTPGWGGYGPGWGYPGWGGYGWGGAWGGGWGGAWGWGAPDVYSVTEYASQVQLAISRSADDLQLFEGRAQTSTTSNAATAVVPQLIAALFAGFPGNSGETVIIKFDPTKPPL